VDLLKMLSGRGGDIPKSHLPVLLSPVIQVLIRRCVARNHRMSCKCRVHDVVIFEPDFYNGDNILKGVKNEPTSTRAQSC
jgi:hypothetical protein